MSDLITDPIAEALNSRLVGSNTFNSSVSLVDTSLSLQFRLYYHMFGNGLKPEIGKILFNECQKIKLAINQSVVLSSNPNLLNIIEKLIYNIMMIIKYDNNEIEEAKKYFERSSSTKIEMDSSFPNFIKLIHLETFYYKHLIGMKNGDNNILFNELLTIIDKIPNQSNGYMHSYLQLIANSIDIKSSTLQEFESRFKNIGHSRSLIHYIYILSNKAKIDKTTDAFLLNEANSILKVVKFPHANESNNSDLIQFHRFLHYYFKDSAIGDNKTWYSFIISSIAKTFRSTTVARTAMQFLALSDNLKESILSFNNYKKYTEKEYELNNDTYADIVSLIESYTFILQRTTDNDSIDNIFDFNATYQRLHSILLSFYQTYKFPLMETKNSTDYLANSSKLVLPSSISGILKEAWSVLYRINSLTLEELQSNNLTTYLSNAMSLSLKPSLSLKFQYAYTLCQQRQIDQCISFLETAILESNPTHYKAWHLLALCRSIQEDKEDSYKIVCSVLVSMLEEVNTLTYDDKWQLLNIKITQLQLVDQIFGSTDTLEVMPELFELYHALFDDEKSTGTGSFSRSKEYLLQSVWLFAADIYMRNGNFDDASQAIKEATDIKTAFNNLNCQIAKGYLYLNQNNYKKALEEFEAVLYHDDMNLDAILGFAEIVFPEEASQSELERQFEAYLKLPNNDKYDNIESSVKNKDGSEIFANNADRSAAYARLKLLLECSINKSIDAFYSAEVWWYLSLIYEKYHDKEYEHSLLNCVQNKETTPLRSFKYCNY